MGSRPIDWTPLADSDPVPGDPDEVERLAARYGRTATAIETAAEKLRSIASADGWVGKAAVEFRDQARGTADSVERAYDRYHETSVALTNYAPSLATAQTNSAKALEEARCAVDDERGAETRRDSEEAKADPDQSVLDTCERQVGNAQAAYKAAERKLAGAVTLFNNSAERAAGKIHDVSQNDGLKTNWKDRLASVLKVIANVAGFIAAVAGLLALVVGWIPIIGQALAAVLGAIALVAGIISLVANIGLLIMGEGSWANVILDVIGVATFGIGRLFTSAAKFSAKSAQLGRGWRAAVPKAGDGRITAYLTGRMPTAGNSLPLFGNSAGAIWKGAFGGLLKDFKGIKTIWQGRSNFPSLSAFPSGMSDAVRSAVQNLPDGAGRLTRLQAGANTLVGNADLAGDLSQILSKTLGPRPFAFGQTALGQSLLSMPPIAVGGLVNAYQFTQAVTPLP
jgi:uncharacterized protein YukE